MELLERQAMTLFLKSALLSSCLISGLIPVSLQAQDSGFGNQSARSPLIRGSILPAEEAFSLNTFIEAPDTVILLWEIRDGYYLYRKSIAASSSEGEAIKLGDLPIGETITDEFFGDVSVYHDRLLQRIPVASFPVDGNALVFTLQYQGCAEDKYCYPMQIKQVEITLPE